MPMALPVLRKLVIKTEDNIARFIEKLHAPELTCVDLTFVKHSKPFISNLLQKRKIRKLSITTRYSLHSSFLDSLRKCPTLIALTIKRDSAGPDLESERNTFTLDDKFLRLLTDDNDPLCPHLEELIYESIIEFTIDGMVEFIRRKQADRNRGLAKLKTISVSNLQSDSDSDSDSEGNNSDSELEAFTAWQDSEEAEHYLADGLKIQHWQPEVVDWDSPTEEHDDDLLISFGNSSAQYCDSWLE
ncbi:hypothetical protein GALMADRAFT_257234 [Galerina marginata CBS 339.88]|uniref:F-box domain-containing protein n=1 Tax=Galerina marginata (strain CBS 339.88) TaxID=685588 RepID=A0A067SBH0_GALM3|nr:hypothetical protein GALMADRAFT_257234 [Galerina marginata CBS 339.88]